MFTLLPLSLRRGFIFFALTHTKTKPRTHGCLSSDSVDDYRAFYLETLKALDKAPSYERAKQKKGPVRCWFTKNANVVFSGCESKMIAEPFAAAFLRKTAKAKGTKKTIGTGLYSGKPTMFSNPVMDENGNVINWDTKSDYWNSPPYG